MKFKIYILSFLLPMFFYTECYAQGNAAARFQATITQTSPNSVMVVLKPNLTFNGQFANVQFAFQIPNSVLPQPTVSIKSNPLATYLPAGSFVITPETGYHTYSYNVNTAGSPVYSFVNGTPFNALEVQFSGATANTNVRLSHLPDGGITSQEAFYVEINGNDNTDYSTMFYGSGAVNGGNISAYSFLQLGSIVLPVKFTSFSATKNDNDALLSWVVENEISLVTNYEVERSIDGIKFDKINTIAKNGGTSNIYNITDHNLAAVKNSGIIYYRIKQMDLNGEFVYSDIKNVRITEKGTIISAFPNPVVDITTVKIDVIEAADVSISLINADGKQLQTSTLKAAKGLNLKKIDMNNLPKGDYLLKVTLGTEVQTIKVIKL
jgi:hypothetical protein